MKKSWSILLWLCFTEIFIVANIICRITYILQGEYNISTRYYNGVLFYVQAAVYKIYQKLALRFHFIYCT